MSVDKKSQHFVSHRLCCSVARAVSALPSRNLLPSISDGECRVPFLSQLKSFCPYFALFLSSLPASSFVFSIFHRALRDRCRGILEFLPRVLVIGREASRVCGFGDLGALDLLQGVDALALVVESVHQMHIDGWMCIFV